LTKILKHPNLWKYEQNNNDDLVQKIENLQREVNHQKEIIHQLEEQNQTFNQF
jgi:hypothetical protein